MSGLGFVLPGDPGQPKASQVGEVFAQRELAVEMHAGNGLDGVVLLDHAVGAVSEFELGEFGEAAVGGLVGGQRIALKPALAGELVEVVAGVN